MVGRNSLESVSVKQPTRKRRGAKERVLARWPRAEVYVTGPAKKMLYQIRNRARFVLWEVSEWCKSRESAWADAARRINDVSK